MWNRHSFGIYDVTVFTWVQDTSEIWNIRKQIYFSFLILRTHSLLAGDCEIEAVWILRLIKSDWIESLHSINSVCPLSVSGKLIPKTKPQNRPGDVVVRPELFWNFNRDDENKTCQPGLTRHNMAILVRYTAIVTFLWAQSEWEAAGGVSLQAWLALVSSSDDFQQSFSFEMWVVSSRFGYLEVSCTPPYLQLKPTLTIPDSY